MIAWLIDIFTVFATVFDTAFTTVLPAASSQDGGSGWLLLAGPAGGAGLYFVLYRFYRNTDKSHSFEREAKIESQPITGSDAKVDEIRGTQSSSIQGNNVRRFRDRVKRVQ